MPDDKSKVGEAERSQVASDQDEEVNDLSQKHGLTLQEARDLIAQRNDREQLVRAQFVAIATFLI